MKRYFNILLIPLTIIIVNHVFFYFLINIFAFELTAYTLFNLVRVLTYIYLGWLLKRELNQTYTQVSLFGILLFFIDHVLLLGGQFLATDIVDGSMTQWSESPFFGVLVSFVLFLPLAAIISCVGAFIGRRRAIPKV